PFDRLCMHEFVVSARSLKKQHGCTALDVAKRLMDYGFHPPTIYFPLIVPEALMLEPTETEAKETLDAFCDAMLAIAGEAAEEPELLKEAPHHRPVKRLDEVRAAKQPAVRYAFEELAVPDGAPRAVVKEAPQGVEGRAPRQSSSEAPTGLPPRPSSSVRDATLLSSTSVQTSRSPRACSTAKASPISQRAIRRRRNERRTPMKPSFGCSGRIHTRQMPTCSPCIVATR